MALKANSCSFGSAFRPHPTQPYLHSTTPSPPHYIPPVEIRVSFYSWFQDLAGCGHTTQELPPNSSVQDLLFALTARFPKLAAADKSVLVAVGLDYQDRSYLLKEGDEVSLFPPVQGG